MPTTVATTLFPFMKAQQRPFKLMLDTVDSAITIRRKRAEKRHKGLYVYLNSYLKNHLEYLQSVTVDSNEESFIDPDGELTDLIEDLEIKLVKYAGELRNKLISLHDPKPDESPWVKLFLEYAGKFQTLRWDIMARDSASETGTSPVFSTPEEFVSLIDD